MTKKKWKKWGQSDFLGFFDYSHRRRSFNIQYFGLYKWSICCINLTLPKPLASLLISSWLKETLRSRYSWYFSKPPLAIKHRIHGRYLSFFVSGSLDKCKDAYALFHSIFSRNIDMSSYRS